LNSQIFSSIPRLNPSFPLNSPPIRPSHFIHRQDQQHPANILTHGGFAGVAFIGGGYAALVSSGAGFAGAGFGSTNR